MSATDSDLNFNHASALLAGALHELAFPVPGIDLFWWQRFNDVTGGLRAGELTLVCAPTGAGKTQFLANVACQMWIQNVPTFIAPVETGDQDFLIRMCSVMDGVDWNTGQAHSQDKVMRLSEKYARRFEESPLYLASYDNRVSIEDMEAMLRFQVQANGVKVALLDNLNFFLKIERASDQNLVIDEAVRMIGNVAKQTKLHIMLVCHPKKTDGGRVVSEFDLKGSSSLVQEAANVLLWNRPPSEAAALDTDREAVFKKMRRRGTAVNKAFWFAYKGGRFEEKNLGVAGSIIPKGGIRAHV